MKQIFEKYYITEEGNIYNQYKKKLSPCDNGKGYLLVNITYNNVVKSYSIHRLVAISFIDNPENKPEVNHRDGNRANNNVNNLEWVTRSENIKHSYEYGSKNVTGSYNPNCSITEEEVHEICMLLSEGKKSSQIRDLGYNYNIVRKIKRKSSWTSISNDYNFK